MSEEFSIDIDEKSIEELKKAINYDELEKRHQRFMNGTETEDDLINGIYHYKIQNDKGLDLDVVEFKYYQKLIDLYNKEKQKNERLVDRTIKYDKTLEHLQRDTISKDKIRGKLLESIREEANKINKKFFEKDKGFEVEGALLQELGAIEGMILELLEEE